MCGIVGYVGPKDCVPILLDGLKRLEYRGYDSAGLAVINGGSFNVLRSPGNLEQLEKSLAKRTMNGCLGIGHTRWATHGCPSEENAHPHVDCKGNIAVVHNGIIENYLHLREELKASGHRFRSETDTEVLAHLIEDADLKDLPAAVRAALKRIEGSFALAVISRDHPERIVAARKDSPLVIGLGDGEFFVASDIPALLKYTRDVIILDNEDLAVVSPQGAVIVDVDDKIVSRESMKVDWDAAAAEKSGYEDFMLKEIHEQPHALKETLRGRNGDSLVFLQEIGLTEEDVCNLKRVFVVACGTSYYAGLVGRNAIEDWAAIPVEADISSEFRYRVPAARHAEKLIGPDTLTIAITQSGETADTMAALREAKARGSLVMAITNVVGSSASREADGVLYTRAGPEIGVVATKTFTSQMLALYLLALHIGYVRGELSAEEKSDYLGEIALLADKVASFLKSERHYVKGIAARFGESENFLFLGRGYGLPLAMEGALKLKEISYIHAEGYPAGEMKHGPIALIEEGLPVVVIATKSSVYDKVVSNIEEVKARGATVLALATEGDKEISEHADYVFFVPSTSEVLTAIPAVVPLQLFAYHIAKMKGLNVDQPRNLAKSVTVE